MLRPQPEPFSAPFKAPPLIPSQGNDGCMLAFNQLEVTILDHER